MIAKIAATPRLLVVSDFDGTLAGFSPDPQAVEINRAACQALDQLATLPQTHVAVLSGRTLADLQKLVPVSPAVQLAGSHGAESSSHGMQLSEQMQQALEHVDRELAHVAAAYPGSYVEQKVFQRVFHVAPLAEHDPHTAARALAQAAGIDAGGAKVMGGKNIVEFSVSPATKGTWITAERDRLQASAVVFMGDDVTDEDGFAVLGPQDLGIKVGAGQTLAHTRLEIGEQVSEFYQQLYRQRAGLPR